jgi:adenosine 3'-phospho 5'-phosphosulfate transporter B3
MVIATIINKRIFQAVEYLAAFAISLGLIIFAAVDWQISPIFHPIGLALVSMSVFADAILPNAQERLFRLGSSRLEVTVYTNFFTLIAMTITTMLSGDLVKLFQLAKTSDTNLIAYMATYICISYIAVSSFMMIVKKYGGVTAVLLSTARKGMTLILSFILFPKAFSYFYVVGAVLVLGGLLVASLAKQKKKHDVSENKLREEINQLLPNNNDIEAGEK